MIIISSLMRSRRHLTGDLMRIICTREIGTVSTMTWLETSMEAWMLSQTSESASQAAASLSFQMLMS
jgi:hypothetical protein